MPNRPLTPPGRRRDQPAGGRRSAPWERRRPAGRSHRRPAGGWAVIAFAFLLAGCRRDALPQNDVPKMAYEVKPAVVRVSAYATAEFHYPAALTGETNTPAEAVVDTGAGDSGSGFIVHPDG